jgi:hypothetical protein
MEKEELKEKNTRLFLDMDGVFCDFERGVQDLQKDSEDPLRSSADFNHEEKTKKMDLIWPMIFEKDPAFFANLKPMAGAMDLWASVLKYIERVGQKGPIFLTGCPKGEKFRRLAEAGKQTWVADHFANGDTKKVHPLSVDPDATVEKDQEKYLDILGDLIEKTPAGHMIIIFCRPNQKQIFSKPLADGRTPILLDDRARAKPLWEKLDGLFLHHETEPVDSKNLLNKEKRNSLSISAVAKSIRALESVKRGGGRRTRISKRSLRNKKKTRRNRSLHDRRETTK